MLVVEQLDWVGTHARLALALPTVDESELTVRGSGSSGGEPGEDASVDCEFKLGTLHAASRSTPVLLVELAVVVIVVVLKLDADAGVRLELGTL